jgi:hypothetical protein
LQDWPSGPTRRTVPGGSGRVVGVGRGDFPVAVLVLVLVVLPGIVIHTPHAPQGLQERKVVNRRRRREVWEQGQVTSGPAIPRLRRVRWFRRLSACSIPESEWFRLLRPEEWKMLVGIGVGSTDTVLYVTVELRLYSGSRAPKIWSFAHKQLILNPRALSVRDTFGARGERGVRLTVYN